MVSSLWALGWDGWRVSRGTGRRQALRGLVFGVPGCGCPAWRLSRSWRRLVGRIHHGEQFVGPGLGWVACFTWNGPPAGLERPGLWRAGVRLPRLAAKSVVAASGWPDPSW